MQVKPSARPAGLPLAEELAWLAGAPDVSQALQRALVEPALDLASRPSKQFRARLLYLAHRVAARGAAPDEATARRLSVAAEAIELLHAGSLIVDDIQDGSASRRGDQTVHERYGLPRALCTGNWLYFWPLRLLAELGLAPADEARAFRIYHEAVEKAHYGQALDLSVKVDLLAQEELPAVCRAVLELKTGAITALAMALGALVAGADAEALAAMQAFGRGFGRALQQLDDLGNLLGRVDRDKRFEDVVQKKPTGVWGFAARSMTAERFAAFRAEVLALPARADEVIERLRADGFFASAAADSRRELEGAFAGLAGAFDLADDAPALAELRAVAERLVHAYGC